MCTLTYIPYHEGYTLTHNRDERSNRPSSNDFKKLEGKDQFLYFPQDMEAKGTWMAFSDRGISICILNGGQKAYLRKPPYQKSRGLVVLESFDFPTVKEFYDNYDFTGLEPFTMIRMDNDGLFGIIHDEDETLLEEFSSTQPHIWSSTTLYKPEIRKAKEEIFAKWLREESSPAPEEITNFHLHKGEKALHNQFVVQHGNFFRTVSLTQIARKSKHSAHLTYLNLIEETRDSLELTVR